MLEFCAKSARSLIHPLISICSKFQNAKKCNAFANEVLHFNPVMSDDEVDFDDYYRSYMATNDDDSQSSTGHYDDADACCVQSELLELCPYPACPSEPIAPPVAEVRGRHRVPVVGLSAPAQQQPVKRTFALQDLPARWWQQPADAGVTAAAPTSEEKRGLLVTAPTIVESGAWNREYTMTQDRSNVCAYDATYGIWVKMSCSGEKNTLTYSLFADSECHFPMKKVEHVLSDVYPQYGKCAKSNLGDKRTSLLVCQGKNGIVPPANLPIEK